MCPANANSRNTRAATEMCPYGVSVGWPAGLVVPFRCLYSVLGAKLINFDTARDLCASGLSVKPAAKPSPTRFARGDHIVRVVCIQRECVCTFVFLRSVERANEWHLKSAKAISAALIEDEVFLSAPTRHQAQSIYEPRDDDVDHIPTTLVIDVDDRVAGCAILFRTVRK